jgi:plasmid stability protein
MPNLTIRNIPEELLEKMRYQAKAEKRSLNNEILMVLEKCVDLYHTGKKDDPFMQEAQVELWEKIAGTWEDSRSTEEITADIKAHRTAGRKVEL